MDKLIGLVKEIEQIVKENNITVDIYISRLKKPTIHIIKIEKMSAPTDVCVKGSEERFETDGIDLLKTMLIYVPEDKADLYEAI